MSEPEPGQPLDYESPDKARTPVSVPQVFYGAFIALAAGPGLTFVSILFSSAVGGGAYAGLGGLVIGGGVGVILTLVALVYGTVASSSPDGKRRGFVPTQNCFGFAPTFGLKGNAAAGA